MLKIDQRATLEGSLDVERTGGFQTPALGEATDPIVILEATEGVSGAFTSPDNIGNGVMLDLDYNPTNVTMRLQRLAPGDTNKDLVFDQLDLVQVLAGAKYKSGEVATWGEGDWDPRGDGLFDQRDIVAAQQAGIYLSGPYAALQPIGETNDSRTSIVYDVGTGELAVDAPAGVELTSLNIDSVAGIFTGDSSQSLGGSFDNDADNNIFKAIFGGSFGSLSFGNVAQPGLAEDFLLSDLTVVGSLQDGGALGDVDLIYVPEPATIALLVMGFFAVGMRSQRNGKLGSPNDTICDG